MTQEEIDALAQRIADAGKGMEPQDWLAALGIAVTQAMMQLDSEERMVACVGWVAVLTRTLTDNWIRDRGN